MRTLTQEEIDQVSGGVDSINIGGLNITGIEAGLALRNVMGAAGVAFGFGYGVGTVANAGWTAATGDTLGNELYHSANG